MVSFGFDTACAFSTKRSVEDKKNICSSVNKSCFAEGSSFEKVSFKIQFI